MTTSTLKTETFKNDINTLTEYTFDILSTEKQVPINKVTISVEEDNDIFEVTVYDNIGHYGFKTKRFKNSDDAHFFAMKKAIKMKSEIK